MPSIVLNGVEVANESGGVVRIGVPGTVVQVKQFVYTSVYETDVSGSSVFLPAPLGDGSAFIQMNSATNQVLITIQLHYGHETTWRANFAQVYTNNFTSSYNTGSETLIIGSGNAGNSSADLDGKGIVPGTTALAEGDSSVDDAESGGGGAGTYSGEGKGGSASSAAKCQACGINFNTKSELSAHIAATHDQQLARGHLDLQASLENTDTRPARS